MILNNPSRVEIKKILDQAKTIAVVGLSPNPSRTSYIVSESMQRAGYRIIPVNPLADVVLGEKSYASLSDIPGKVDIVNVFRRSEFLEDIANEFMKMECPVFWTQLNVVDENVFNRLSDAGYTVIMDRCVKVEHAILK
ncbi:MULTISPECIES: CoA-binding protein [Planococcus]|uniref:CoA-binding protein n=2 Tax=Planococcus TaxID=1372 RepID=A0ABM5WWS2_9BACL|nr:MULTISPECIES: CoA-binding protein [Planococcus]ALS78795.1 CoA-binding protein [Planococcus kocurii]AQU79250.1 CoA-binding protein [Planococcus faecalis]MDJ0332364.1 CoA-binding protein [Planococcus sp. S3-L1]OHX52289.1 CoA-binding protein [Planococcus faecalis]